MRNSPSYVTLENYFYVPCFPYLHNGDGMIIPRTSLGCLEDHMYV